MTPRDNIRNYRDAGWQAAEQARARAFVWMLVAVLLFVCFAIAAMILLASRGCEPQRTQGTQSACSFKNEMTSATSVPQRLVQGIMMSERRKVVTDYGWSHGLPPARLRPAGGSDLKPASAALVRQSRISDFEFCSAAPAGCRISPEGVAWLMVWANESSSGRDLRVGDGGAAHGHGQYHESRWNEICQKLGVDWPWPEDCYDLAKVRVVTIGAWYLERAEEIAAGDVETLVRRHRLPYAPYREDNEEYWKDAQRRAAACGLTKLPENSKLKGVK